MRVPVLTYHATNIAGNDYHNNDHVAFARDLRTIHERGLRIVPLHWVVDQLLGKTARDLRNCVALSCDDGTILDYHDVEHPAHGRQRSLFNCMRDFQGEHGINAQIDLHLTCFVIADPVTRDRLDRIGMGGRGWWHDDWWQAAQKSGRIAIENHSWDHNHACLENPGPHALRRGNFNDIVTAAQAEFEIDQAQDYLRARLGSQHSRLFCYPFSQVSDYLRLEWLPSRGAQIGLDAAFGAAAMPIDDAADRWNLPRYVCGWHWQTPDEFARILPEAT